jgi:hypothetical protein
MCMTDIEKILWGTFGALIVTLVGAAIIGTIKLLAGKQADRTLLTGHLDISAGIDMLSTIGCAGLILTITCKSKRPAKIKEAYISLIVGPDIVKSFEKGFNFPFGQGSNQDLPATKCIVKLIPISKPSNKDGYVLERDDVCKFVLPIQIPILPLPEFAKSPSEDVSICVKYINDDEIILMKGLEIQEAIRGLIDMCGNLPMNLKVPLSVALKVSTTTLPDSSGIVGRTNPNPILFHGRKASK